MFLRYYIFNVYIKFIKYPVATGILTYVILISEIERNRDYYKNTDVRPPFTYASLIRQVSIILLLVLSINSVCVTLGRECSLTLSMTVQLIVHVLP